MAQLRVNSAQQLARNWDERPEKIARNLVRLARNSPSFSYAPLLPWLRDMLLLHVSIEQIRETINRRVKRKDVRGYYIELIDMVSVHFSGITPDFVNSVSMRHYSAGRELRIPFEPPIIYGIEGTLHCPWFSWWKHNPLTGNRLSLFVSIAQEIFLADPNLESAKFSILDFSSPSAKGKRVLKEIDPNSARVLTASERREMLEIFAEGLRLAQIEIDREPRGKKSTAVRDEAPDTIELFPWCQ